MKHGFAVIIPYPQRQIRPWEAILRSDDLGTLQWLVAHAMEVDEARGRREAVSAKVSSTNYAENEDKDDARDSAGTPMLFSLVPISALHAQVMCLQIVLVLVAAYHIPLSDS
ncbi:hypothetical protein MTO96_031131 [Rhipicephalus appendiculatus]